MATNVKRKKKAEVMPDDGNMTLTGHLKELRNRLIVCAVVFVAAVVVTFAAPRGGLITMYKATAGAGASVGD